MSSGKIEKILLEPNGLLVLIAWLLQSVLSISLETLSTQLLGESYDDCFKALQVKKKSCFGFG